jgi:hypothetical protein
MTDAEITRLLAERVMGWPVTRTLSEAGIRVMDRQAQVWEVDEPGFMGKPVPRIITGTDGEPWEPLERIDHAWQVQESIVGKGLREYGTFLDAMRGGIPAWIGSAQEVARRICIVALRVSGCDVDGEEG